MNILLVAATTFEIASIIKELENKGTKKSFFEFEYFGHRIYPLVTGIGSMKTAFAIARICNNKEFDLAINMGIAGSLPGFHQPGVVVEVVEDCFADLGVEEQSGAFTDLFELELEDRNTTPFKNGKIYNEENISQLFNIAKGITVNTTHGSRESIKKLQSKYDFEVETMEGAAFFYACKILDIPCHQIRAISNLIEPRDRENWAIGESLASLHKAFFKLIETRVKKLS